MKDKIDGSPAMHRVFAAKDVDAVIMATPDHWHTPASILACQAGKDVYVEKPHAHNIWESQQLRKAVEKYQRVVQVGTQNRSGAYIAAAREYIESGKLGPIHLVKVYNLKPGKAFHLGEPGDQPPGFDWNTWQGAASERPWHKNIFSYGWHHFWDYSGGDMANDGIHQLDLAMMILGDPGFPQRVSCSAGRLAHPEDDSEVPDMQVVHYQFKRFIMTFEQSAYPRYMRKTTLTIRRKDEYPFWTHNATRVELYGSEQMMTVGRHGGGWQVTISGGLVKDQMYGRPCDDEHYQNFLKCVKTRQRPTADVAVAHAPLTMVHMANISHRLGNVSLAFDAENECFKENASANQFLKRSYRKGFEIPEVL